MPARQRGQAHGPRFVHAHAVDQQAAGLVTRTAALLNLLNKLYAVQRAKADAVAARFDKRLFRGPAALKAGLHGQVVAGVGVDARPLLRIDVWWALALTMDEGGEPKH